MNRRVSYGSLYVPTRMDAAGTRHIIVGRDRPTLCETEASGEQVAPCNWSRSALCPRCVQKYMASLFGAAKWEGASE
jgi:hypothetical protein